MNLEVIFLFPFAISLYYVSFYGFWVTIIFLIILTIGFVYEFSLNREQIALKLFVNFT